MFTYRNSKLSKPFWHCLIDHCLEFNLTFFSCKKYLDKFRLTVWHNHDNEKKFAIAFFFLSLTNAFSFSISLSLSLSPFSLSSSLTLWAAFFPNPKIRGHVWRTSMLHALSNTFFMGGPSKGNCARIKCWKKADRHRKNGNYEMQICGMDRFMTPTPLLAKDTWCHLRVF